MTAFNIVRFKVKPGHEKDFVDFHRNARRDFAGLRRAALVDTGNGTYCFVGEWNAFSDIVNARPQMIGILDSFRHILEDFGGGLGPTDPVSGEAVVEFESAAARP